MPPPGRLGHLPAYTCCCGHSGQLPGEAGKGWLGSLDRSADAVERPRWHEVSGLPKECPGLPKEVGYGALLPLGCHALYEEGNAHF